MSRQTACLTVIDLLHFVQLLSESEICPNKYIKISFRYFKIQTAFIWHGAIYFRNPAALYLLFQHKFGQSPSIFND